MLSVLYSLIFVQSRVANQIKIAPAVKFFACSIKNLGEIVSPLYYKLIYSGWRVSTLDDDMEILSFWIYYILLHEF